MKITVDSLTNHLAGFCTINEIRQMIILSYRKHLHY